MLQSLRLNLFGNDSSPGSEKAGGGLFSFGDKDESPADQFASWLPYISYLDEEQLFVNKDGMGFMLEVMPQSGADDRMVDVLVSLYSNCPPDTGVQFHLFASPHVCPPLRKYANLRMEDPDQIQKAQEYGRPARNENLYRKLARRRFSHLAHGAHHSLTQGFHYTIRDFRLMVSVTVKADPNLTNPYGYTHGGVLSTLADSAAAVAIAGIVKGKGKKFMTIDMNISYISPVSGGVIEAHAKALREGRIVPAEVDIINENKLVAKAIATYIIVDDKKD